MQRWSPLTTLPKHTLTQAGLISIDSTDNEVQLISRSDIEIRSLSPTPLQKPASMDSSSSPWIDRDTDLVVTLTTHRIVFQSNDNNAAHFLHHCAMHPLPHGIEATGGNWTSNRSYKILLASITHGNFNLIFRKGQKDRDAFFDYFQKALVRRQWEESYRLQQNQQTGMGSSALGKTTKRVGVEAILQRNQHRHDRAKRLTEDAFGKGTKKQSKDERAQEVEVLFREAKELTGIIHKYVATLEKNQIADGGIANSEEDTTELTSLLQDMGMITALTKESASDKSFHEMLARQICDFLSSNKAFKINKGGSGIMTLTDVYCLYNRARGANMISPEDLIEVLGKMESLGLGMKLREFDGSGVKVLQETGFDDHVMASKLIEHIESEEGLSNAGKGGGIISYFTGEVEMKKVHVGLTALEAARVLKIPPLLANEQLLSAEQNGYLCRDVTMEGTRYYRNLFVSMFA